MFPHFTPDEQFQYHLAGGIEWGERLTETLRTELQRVMNGAELLGLSGAEKLDAARMFARVLRMAADSIDEAVDTDNQGDAG